MGSLLALRAKQRSSKQLSKLLLVLASQLLQFTGLVRM